MYVVVTTSKAAGIPSAYGNPGRLTSEPFQSVAAADRLAEGFRRKGLIAYVCKIN